ncbi:MAG: DNA adenine methylase [Deltaproteobacteria bacterium]|nr:DNA adenine methylase [Deltaproteobacteria bacterium]
MSRKQHFIPYIGGKYKLAGQISKRLHATGKTCLVDVFGGSGAVTIHSGYNRRIYNDINCDFINLFKVMADDKQRAALLRKLKWTPASRQIFNEDHAIHVKGGHSFKEVDDPVERARMTFYKHIFCFGGKVRSGGFAVSFKDCDYMKEVNKYNNVLKSFAKFGRFFRNTVLENLDFVVLIEKYGHKEGVVLFVDPPYPDFSAYYRDNLTEDRQRELASLLIRTPAPVICTFYDHPLVRELYPEELWKYEVVGGSKNSIQGGSRSADELIMTKKDLSPEQIDRWAAVINPQGDLWQKTA